MRLAGVTGPCPKCGATIVAPKPVAEMRSTRELRGDGNGRGLGGTTHHREPSAPAAPTAVADGRKGGLSSLRRRRQPVVSPLARFSDEPVESLETGLSEAEMGATSIYGTVEDDFSAETVAYAPAPEPMVAPAVGEIPDVSAAVPTEPVAELPVPAPVLAPAPAPEPVAEVPAAAPEPEPAPAPAMIQPFEHSWPKPKAKAPINLQRSADPPAAVQPVVPAAPETPAVTPEPEPLPVNPVAESVAAALSLGQGYGAPTEEEPAEAELPRWGWSARKSDTAMSPAPEPVQETVAPAAETEIPTDTAPMPDPVSDKTATDGSELLVGEDDSFEISRLGSLGLRKAADTIAPLVDLDTDLDAVIPKGPEASSVGAPLPPAPGAFPKWSSLEGNPLIQAQAPVITGVKSAVEAEVAPPPPPVDEMPAPAPRPLMSGPVWAPPVGASDAKASPWLPVARVPAAADEAPAEAPEADAVAPALQSPRFLGSESNRTIPWKPPIPEGFTPAAPAPAAADASKAPESLSLPLAEPAAQPPLLDLSTFGEGEPPRPGDRATPPALRINLPQTSSIGDTTAKATVSTVPVEPKPAFEPLEPAPVEDKAEEPAPDADRSVAVEDKVPAAPESMVPPAAEPTTPAAPAEESAVPPPLTTAAAAAVPAVEEAESESKSLFSARAQAVALSLKKPVIGSPAPVAAAEPASPPPLSAPLSQIEPADADEIGLPSLKLNIRPRQKSEEPVEAEKMAAPVEPAPGLNSLRLDRLAAGDKPDLSGSDLALPNFTSSKLAEKLANRDPEARKQPEPAAPVENPAAPAEPAAIERPEPAPVAHDPEDDGMARRLGLLPRETKPTVMETRDDATDAEVSETPLAESGAPAAPEKAATSLNQALPKESDMVSVDDILSRPNTKVMRRKETLVDRFIDWRDASEGRRKAVLVGGIAAGGVVLVSVIGALAGWFGGDDAADASGKATVVLETPSTAPKSPVILADNSKASPDGAPAWSDSVFSKGEADPNGKAAPAAPAATQGADTTVAPPAAGSGTPAPTVQTEVPKAPVGSPTATAPDNQTIVLPGVGNMATTGAAESTDPFTSEGGFTEIGSTGKAPAEAPAAGTPANPAPTTPETAMARQAEQALSVDSLVEPTAPSEAMPGAPVSEENRLIEQRTAIEKFLAAKTWQERLTHVYRADQVKAEIEAHYKNHPDGPVAAPTIQWFDMDEAPTDGGDPFYAFYVSFEGAETEFPMVVRKEGDAYKVDWRLYAECKDRLFAEFRDSGESGPASFYLVMQRHSYWGKDRTQFRELENLNCYKIEPPYPGFETFVFLPKDSPHVALIEEIAGWGLPPVDVVLEMERRKFAHGESHLVIKSIKKTSWVAP